MKIAVWHNLPSGGGKRALFDHVRGLVERGHTVKSWCPSTADQTYLPLSQLIEERVLPFASKSRVSKNRLSVIAYPYRDVSEKLDEMDRHCLKFVFFFQAEDGIRVATVTGVQTCALPI